MNNVCNCTESLGINNNNVLHSTLFVYMEKDITVMLWCVHMCTHNNTRHCGRQWYDTIMWHVVLILQCTIVISNSTAKVNILHCGEGLNPSIYMLARSVIRRKMVSASYVPFALTMLTIHSVSECHQLAPASAADWFAKGSTMYYHVFEIMHVKDP